MSVVGWQRFFRVKFPSKNEKITMPVFWEFFVYFENQISFGKNQGFLGGFFRCFFFAVGSSPLKLIFSTPFQNDTSRFYPHPKWEGGIFEIFDRMLTCFERSIFGVLWNFRVNLEIVRNFSTLLVFFEF